MPMKKLPNNVQSLLSSSFYINSYKRAIEELVFNSLDSESTCIAIRFNIEEGKIQVIDNGHGIEKCDLTLLGHRYTTSKCVDLSNLKSAPNKYGWRGQSLASLTEVSQTVKITTRCTKIQDTWVKAFYNGKEEEISKCSIRPSRGTTVELKGFLYNLSIQKKNIDVLKEQRNIKTFLEQLSLVHCNISISLRDDSKNVIIFKLNKNRDIYQTLSSLFMIRETNTQELTVEKNEYKVIAYIGKRDCEISKPNWIYLNRRYVNNSKLYKIVNNSLNKLLHLKNKPKGRNKRLQNINNEEDEISKDTFLFYFIFISCPYYDYDISSTPKQSVLEFSDWERITNLLEKLIKFYVGDVNLQEVKCNKNQTEIMVDETRDQIREIIEKILGNNSKKLCVSQMQNGIKGKQAKRKRKKKGTEISLSRVIPKANIDVIIGENSLNPAREHLNSSSNKILYQDFSNKKKKKSKLYKVGENVPKRNFNITPHNYEIINEHKKDKCDENIEVNSLIRDTNKSTLIEAEMLPDKKKRKQKIYVNKSVEHHNIIRENKNLSIQKKVNEVIIHDYIPLPPKFNARHFDRQVWRKVKNKPFKSTYDLVQTILNTQREYNIDIENYIPYEVNRQSYRKDYTEGKDCIVSDIDLGQKKSDALVNCTPTDRHNVSGLTYQSHNYLRTKETNGNVPNFNTQNRKHFITNLSKDNFSVSIDKITNNKHRLHRKKYKTQYNKELGVKTKIPCAKRLSMFNINDDLQGPSLDIEFSECYDRCYFYDRPIRKNKLYFSDLFSKRVNTLQSNVDIVQLNESVLLNDNTERYHQRISETNGISFHYKGEKKNAQQVWSNRISSPGSNFHTYSNVQSSKSDITCNNQKSLDNNNCIENNEEYEPFLQGTYTVDKSINYLIRHDKSDDNNSDENSINMNNNLIPNDLNIVFISESKNSETDIAPDKYIEPLNVCEAILNDRDMFEDFEHNFNVNDSLFNSDFNIIDINEPKNICGNSQHNSSQVPIICNLTEITNNSCGQNSNFNNNILSPKTPETINENAHENNEVVENEIFSLDKYKNDNSPKEYLPKQTEYLHHDPKLISADAIEIVNANNFSFKNRLRFIPKGMSPIFQNCNSINPRDYNTEEEYFENNIYDNFAADVQVNSEVFEPGIQNVKDLATRHIEKINNRLNKDESSLIFNRQSLKQAKILNQVDDKFIAAVLMGESVTAEGLSEVLVLFDQHAVHERIRLERNLSEYLYGDKWKSITMENNISLKLTTDEVLYLHNYKDKFTQLGLKWDISSSCEISVFAIPEAILGKNPRKVEVVMKSVKNLILEEVNILRSQSGCISLYPKSIMDLVFSEACRYAIKFGDKLSKNDCIELLNNLSDCKTSFQCAHGRPVMAVIVDIKRDQHQYKVDNTKLWQFKANCC